MVCKRIFTFWEPKEKMPAYIKLCMLTWKKFLPDYEIVVLDYSNLHEYMSDKAYNNVVFKYMSLAKQSDAIRAALLYENGGIWMDADTIITSKNFLGLIQEQKSDVIMIGRPKTDGVIYGAFIFASKPLANFMSDWYKALPSRIERYRWLVKHPILRKLFYRKAWLAAENWDYCVNAIIDDLGKKYKTPDFLCIDRDEIVALPEYLSPLANLITNKSELYRKYYFHPEGTNILPVTQGIILLHNSWTPEEYRQMDEQTFIEQPILLADILREVLK